jgi:hypothetical protein
MRQTFFRISLILLLFLPGNNLEYFQTPKKKIPWLSLFDFDLQASLKGKISVKEDKIKKGIPGQVQLFLTLGNKLYFIKKIRANRHGEFSFKNLPRGEYIIEVRYKDMARTFFPITLLHPIPLEGIEITLKPGLSLKGKVKEINGRPIPNAKIEAYPLNSVYTSPFESFTTKEGNFVLSELSSEIYQLKVSAKGFAKCIKEKITPHQKRVDFILEGLGQINGQVIQKKGIPVPNASVILAGSSVWPPKEVKTNKQGLFLFKDIPEGIYEIQARKEDLVSNVYRGIEIKKEKTQNISMLVYPGSILSGQVKDAKDKKGIPNARIVLKRHELSLFSYIGITNKQGLFKIKGIPPQKYILSVKAEDYLPFVLHDVQIEAKDKKLEINLEKGGIVKGRVIDAQGFPIRNAMVSLHYYSKQPLPFLFSPSRELGVTSFVPPIPPSSTSLKPLIPFETKIMSLTDAYGEFILSGVPAGKVRVKANHSNYASGKSHLFSIKEREIITNIEITLSKGANLEGRVLDSQMFPIESAQINLNSLNLQEEKIKFSDKGGFFFFDSLLGEIEIKIYKQGYMDLRERLKIKNKKRLKKEFILKEANLILEGRVRDNSGFPIAGALITLSSDTPSFPFKSSTLSDSDGSFYFKKLGEIIFKLEASYPGYIPLTLKGIKPSKKVFNITLEYGSGISGKILEQGSNIPIRDFTIIILSQNKKIKEKRFFSTSGEFKIRGIKAGKLQIKVIASGYEEKLIDLVVPKAERYNEITNKDLYLTLKKITPGL